MRDVGEPVPPGDPRDDRLKVAELDFNGVSASPTDQMVVVRRSMGAAAVGRLTVGRSDRINLARLGHRLQGAVDGRQGHRIAATGQEIMNLLRRAEPLMATEDVGDRSALTRPSGLAGGRHASRLASRRPTRVVTVIAVSRFRVSAEAEPTFVAQGRAASDFYRTRPGCEGSELVRNLDDPTLWALISRWADVGSYRRAYNGFDAKVILTPLLIMAVDEPGAFDIPDAVGANQPRGE